MALLRGMQSLIGDQVPADEQHLVSDSKCAGFDLAVWNLVCCLKIFFCFCCNNPLPIRSTWVREKGSDGFGRQQNN